MDQEKLTLEQQILNLFATYTQQKIPKDVVERIKEVMKQNLQQVVSQTIKRSILRDSFNNQLDDKDLLSVIESNIFINIEEMGPKYKTAIGYHLIKKQLTNVKGMQIGGGVEGQEGGDD